MDHLIFSLLIMGLTSWCMGSVPFWPSAGDANKPQDCKWGPWLGTKCVKEGKVFRIHKTRMKFKAKNGGKDCEGISSRKIACSIAEYVAESLYRTISTGSESSASGKGGGSWSSWTALPGKQRPGQPQPGKQRPEPPPDNNEIHKFNPCAERLYDEQGELRIAGKCETKNNVRGRSRQDRRRRRKRTILSTNTRDLLFLIDGSGSIGKDNYGKVLEFIKTMTSKFCGGIDIAKNKTRVAVMTFTHEQTPNIDFDDYFDKPNIIKNMGKIKYTGGGTCIIDALDFTRKDMISPARGARNFEPGTERVVVFITDGCDECRGNYNLLNKLKEMQKNFENQEIAFISHFIGKGDSCTKEILALADGSRCHQYHRADNWVEFESMTNYIAQQPCMDAWRIGVPCTL